MFLNSSAWELHEQKGWLSASRGEQVLGRNSCACTRTRSIYEMPGHSFEKRKTQMSSRCVQGDMTCCFFIAVKLSNVQTIKYSQLHSKRQCPSCCREGLMRKAFQPHPLGGTRILSLLPNRDSYACQIQGLSFRRR